MGFETVTGYNPRHKNEIALGVNVANSLNKEQGDIVDVYIEGKKQSLIVTGIYQAIANSSYSARVTIDAVRSVNPSFNDMDVALINIKNISQADTVVSDLNASFKDSASVVTQKTLLDSVFKEASNILIYPMSLVGLLFVIVTFIIIYSTCRIQIRKESRTYGIYKSIGMTSRRIRLSIALGIAGLSVLGALLGILIGVYLLPLLLESILASYGIVKLPVIIQSGRNPRCSIRKYHLCHFWFVGIIQRDTENFTTHSGGRITDASSDVIPFQRRIIFSIAAVFLAKRPRKGECSASISTRSKFYL